jgi:hypothetical protein
VPKGFAEWTAIFLYYLRQALTEVVMYDLFFSDYALFFTIPAVVGTLLFLLRIGMMTAGLDDSDGGVDVGGLDAGMDAGGLDGATSADATSDFAFEFISLQAIAAFCMGAGWGGLGAYRGSNLGVTTSVVIAIGSGLLMMWLLYRIMKAVYGLRGSGNISVRDAVGRMAQVYVTIPAAGQGSGQVQVVIRNALRTMTAVSEGPEIPRQASVRVVRANADNTLVVGPKQAEGEVS